MLADGRIVCAYAADGIDHLAVIDRRERRPSIVDIETGYTAIASLRVYGDGAVFVAGSPTAEPVIAVVDLAERGHVGGGGRPPRDLGIDPGLVLGAPSRWSIPTEGGAKAHAIFYPPGQPRLRRPAGAMPPLLVMSHGGPTARDPRRSAWPSQYWT